MPAFPLPGSHILQDFLHFGVITVKLVLQYPLGAHFLQYFSSWSEQASAEIEGRRDIVNACVIKKGPTRFFPIRDPSTRTISHSRGIGTFPSNFLAKEYQCPFWYYNLPRIYDLTVHKKYVVLYRSSGSNTSPMGSFSCTKLSFVWLLFLLFSLLLFLLLLLLSI